MNKNSNTFVHIAEIGNKTAEINRDEKYPDFDNNKVLTHFEYS